ncbi:hypothetical protein JW865_08705 [Candidatus Bathyarchaeota archaeon]|nr:hypothetical protein [Candidatus Bathyarchaeota archaeon]
MLVIGLLLGVLLTIACSNFIDTNVFNFNGKKVNELTEINEILTNELNYLREQYEELLENYTQLQLKYYMNISQEDKSLINNELIYEGKGINRNYSWYFNYNKWTLSLSIPEELYIYYKTLSRTPSSDYSIYVTHPYDDVYIDLLLVKLNEISVLNGFSDFNKIGLVISFIQSLQYTSDSISTGYDEYPRYPIETLVDYGGDCEDTSILAAALFKALGKEVVLLMLPNHLAVGIAEVTSQGYYYQYNGKDYYYLETTGEGWDIGELPEEYQESTAKIFELLPIPVIFHTWVSTWEFSKIILTITVENLGTAIAQNYYVEAGFDAGNDSWWNSQKSQYFNITIDGKIKLTLVLQPPKNQYTRLIVQILNSESKCVDISYSKWFTT